MLLFIKILVWLVFTALLVYIVFSWKGKINPTSLTSIRKTWYGIFLFGALVYWTDKPNSILVGWKNYLIVAVIFMLVDAFIFLSLYLKKVGNNELQSLPETINELSDKIGDNKEKIRITRGILLSDSIIGYYESNEDYLNGLKSIIQEYAAKERLVINFFSYSTTAEKEELMNRHKRKNFINIDTQLNLLETYYSNDSKLALYPFTLNDSVYVLEIRTTKSISEVDILLVDILINMFTLSSELYIIEGGISND